MSLDGKNPCDVCQRKDNASGCFGCAIDFSSMQYECSNDQCMLNYELGCLLGLDEVCKASPEFLDDIRDHDCSECVRFREKLDDDGVPYWTCCDDGEEIGKYDEACENFEEA